MGRGFRLSDEPPLTPLEIYREKRRRAREKSSQLKLLRPGVSKELLEWLIKQRIELVGNGRQDFITITMRRVLVRTKIVVHQDLKKTPEQIPISEIGPHGKRCGVYLPFYKL